jgi:hypothetical protein
MAARDWTVAVALTHETDDVTVQSLLLSTVMLYVPPDVGTDSGMFDSERYKPSAAICVIVTLALDVPSVTVMFDVRSSLVSLADTLRATVQIWPLDPVCVIEPTLTHAASAVTVGCLRDCTVSEYSPPDLSAVMALVGTLKSVLTGDGKSLSSLQAVTDVKLNTTAAKSHKSLLSFTIVRI